MTDTLIARPLHAFVRAPIRFKSQPAFLTSNGKRGGTASNSLWRTPSTIPIANSAARRTIKTSLALILRLSKNAMRANDGLQLRRAISIQAEGIRLLKKHAIAPSAARLC
jgi:hypothetical protein